MSQNVNNKKNIKELLKKIFYYVIEYLKEFNPFSLKFLYNSRYLVISMMLFVIIYGFATKNTFLALLGVLILLFTIITWFEELIIIKKWENILEPIFKEELDENLYELYSNNKLYRLGDMICHKIRWSDEGEKYHFNAFPHSIATEYMKKSKTQKNYNVLANIIRERSKFTNDLPKNNDLVIHLRLGDTIEKNPHNLIQILTSYTYMQSFRTSSNYTCPIRNIQEKINKLKHYNIQKIILVSASHLDIPTPKSSKYINVMKRYLEKKGYIVELRLGKNPDEDFIFMSNSKYFIPACSGYYTHLVKTIVKIMGGKVI
jgi:hypothetical protein